MCDNLDLKGSFWLGLSEASQSKISRESWLSSFKSGSAFRVWASSAQLGKSKFWFPICAWCSFIWSHHNLIKNLDVTSRFSASRIYQKRISHYAHYDILNFQNKIDIADLWLSRNLFYKIFFRLSMWAQGTAYLNLFFVKFPPLPELRLWIVKLGCLMRCCIWVESVKFHFIATTNLLKWVLSKRRW